MSVFSLFGRYAFFRVYLTIHDISNIPLVTGNFAVKWKFKNAHTVTAAVASKASHDPRTNGRDKEAGQGLASVSGAALTAASPEHGHALAGLGHSQTPIPSRPVTPHRIHGHHQETKPSSKGRTDFVPITEHNVKWEHDIDVFVHAGVNRETTDLLLSELRLVVIQESIHGDVDRPKNPTFGVLYLNLSEYASPGLGPVTRRYLLREGKTNATLKLTIELEHCGGEKIFKPPPLQKAQVMTTVTGLLSNDHHHLRPPISPGAGSTHSFHHVQSGRSTPRRPSLSPQTSSRSTLQYDPQFHSSLPSTSTETIIEALFNPYPSAISSPFTVPPPRRTTSQGTMDPHRSVANTSAQPPPSIEADNQSLGDSESSHTTSTASTRQSSQTANSWWRRIAGGSSRPPTPSIHASPQKKRTSFDGRSELGVH